MFSCVAIMISYAKCMDSLVQGIILLFVVYHWNACNPPHMTQITNPKQQYHLYITERKRQKKNAAKYGNSIHAYIFDIGLNKVSPPPYLHILLGNAKRHHDLLELECHELVKAIAIHTHTIETRVTPLTWRKLPTRNNNTIYI